MKKLLLLLLLLMIAWPFFISCKTPMRYKLNVNGRIESDPAPFDFGAIKIPREVIDDEAEKEVTGLTD